jgi:hypothetical protein
MRVELSDPDLVDDLVTFLRSARYEAEHTDEGTLAVRPPASVPEELAEIALEESLAAWQTLHPGVRVRRRCAYDL